MKGRKKKQESQTEKETKKKEAKEKARKKQRETLINEQKCPLLGKELFFFQKQKDTKNNTNNKPKQIRRV